MTEDLSNPYRPGRLDLPASSGPLHFQPGQGKIEVAAALRAAWPIFQKHWVLGTVATLALQFLSFGVSLVGQIFQLAGTFTQSEELTTIGAAVGGLLSILIGPAVAAGPIYLALHAVDKERYPAIPVAFEQVLIGFKRFWSVLGAYWSMALFVSAPLFIAAGLIVGYLYAMTEFLRVPEFQEIMVAVAIGLPAFAAMAYLALRNFFAMVVCLDQKVGPVEAIRRSWVLTEGNVLSLLGLTASFMGIFFLALIPWLILAVITCGVGFLALFSLVFYYNLAGGLAYRMLFAHPAPPEDLNQPSLMQNQGASPAAETRPPFNPYA